MKTSASITQIAAALVAAQSGIAFAVKDSKNPHFRSDYAGLPSVIDAVKPHLNANGIAFVQSPSPSDDGKIHLTTRLIHVSGEWIEDTAVCPLPKPDPQGFGSAMTYVRRYSLAALCGLYQDDDDGQAASSHQPEPSKPVASKPEPSKRTTPVAPPDPIADAKAVVALASKAQLNELTAFQENKITATTMVKALAHYKVVRPSDLTVKQAHFILTRCRDIDAAVQANHDSDPV